MNYAAITQIACVTRWAQGAKSHFPLAFQLRSTVRLHPARTLSRRNSHATSFVFSVGLVQRNSTEPDCQSVDLISAYGGTRRPGPAPVPVRQPAWFALFCFGGF